ncbi:MULTISPECIES: hypothetical protein [Haloferacaceae]|uniref:Alpha/beta hydrolase n=1 Tax=Halorubrum glutamatedens TaxID=2707018 RepID=A0ABD5QVZ6_9EURY|nr:hypothetical protein [Halobellus captivus]
MTVPKTHEATVTVRVDSAGPPSVRDGGTGRPVVSILFETDLETWRRTWSERAGEPPRREAVVVASDHSRGAAATATTQVLPERKVAYTVLGSDAGTDRVLETVSGMLTEFDGSEPRVILDDLASFAVTRGAGDAADAVERIATETAAVNGSVTIGWSLSAESAAAMSTVLGRADSIEGVDPEPMAAIGRLQREDPTTFGYTRRYWPEAQRGIECCSRNYPQSKQVHAVLSNPETTPRTLGATLSGLVSLEVLDTWTDTVGSTRYDLTAYDPSRMAAIGAAFATTCDDGSEHALEE